ncbi:hypothetical protein BDR26DRAFT_952672 [Obelidium mucronatum]|nr:hypothetical protein BDR26DRAFT_952672 [Obelidium mucronatum]
MTENNEKEPSIHILLKSAPLVTLPPQAAHSSWPDIRRPAWSALGDKLTRQEQLVTRLLPSNQWISLRLDLKGFSSQSRRLFPSRKYSPLFATAMHNTLLALMTETQASYGFTHVVLMQQFMKQRIPLPFLAPEQLGKDTESGKDSSLKPTVQFDARAAGWESLQDAFELILWRAQDCTVNGLSDAVHKSDLPEKKGFDRVEFLAKGEGVA